MAIAGSLIKGATKVVGKAINVAKKKKKDLETKGRRTKKALNSDMPDVVTGAGASTIQAGKKIAKNPTVKKAVKKTKEVGRKALATTAAIGGAVGAAGGGFAAEKGAKAIRAVKGKKTSKEQSTDDFVKGAAVGATAGIIGGPIAAGIGALALTQSLTKSNAKPEQQYETKRLPDGRFSTTFGGNNANVVFASKQLSEKEINEVRTQLAVLDSIIDSSDPKTRRKEFTETVEMLSKKYGISNITGKNLSVLIPMSK
tara:strand:- start:47 stop:814 length:768 start_codon:yes stop_codon:yes gene_type:complete